MKEQLLVVTNNIFVTFDGSIYQEMGGANIISPLRPVLAEICLVAPEELVVPKL